MAELYNISNSLGGGVLSWATSVSAVTAYRTDYANGITAAKVPYSAVVAVYTVTAAPSAGGIALNTTGTALTAVTTSA